MGKTLQLTRPAGGTLTAAIFILLILVAVLEVAARSRPLQNRLASPSLGSGHYQLGSKRLLLEMMAAEAGGVDCLILGSSQTDRGLDPEIVAQAFERESGRKIRCFNFAIDGLPSAGTAVLADILVAEYRPSILIVGTDARDYAVPSDAEDLTIIVDSPWVRYRSGRFDPQGWALDHAYAVRYRRQWQQLLRFQDDEALENSRAGLSPRGFTADSTVNLDVDRPPAADDESFQVGYYSELLSDYQLQPENLDGLTQILSYSRDDLQVYLVEMPVPAGYFSFFGNGMVDYELFIEAAAGRADEAGVIFWQTTPLNLIPDDGWLDFSHVNSTGAAALSDWLGEVLGREESG